MTTPNPKPGKPMPKHVDRTTTPYNGALKVDATAVAPLLVDLPKGARKGLRRSGPGIDEVAIELAAFMPVAGAAAGIPQALYDTFAKQHADVTQLEQIAMPLLKLAEVLTETLALAQDAREQALSKIADDIRSTAKRDRNDGIKAPFQKTLAYKSQAAEKGVKTRAQKKAAKAGTPPAAH
jgi:hypothetical protein